MYHMVYDFGIDEYFFKVNPQRFRQAGHIDHHTICLGLAMVSDFCLGGISLSYLEALHPSTEERSKEAI